MWQQIKALSLVLVAISMFPGKEASAGKCGPDFVNPITDVNWQCIFPIRIGGLMQVSAGGIPDPDPINDPICTCPPAFIGINVSFFEPARMIDTVSDPYCFMAAGTQLANPSPGQLAGGLHRHDATARAFEQMHYYIFPAWAVLDMFVDFPCIDAKGFDVAMISEVLPTWNNEITGAILNPEAALFGNPATQLACAADATGAMVGYPLDSLFWCMGSWGNAYPLGGSITATDYVEANAGLAARSIYFMGRTGLLLDPGVSSCGSVPTPIWKKKNYRLQVAKPVRDSSCRVIGQSGLLWTHVKNPPMAGDNFAWMVFRKVKCCVTY